MRFTILLGLSAAVSALPLDGSDKSLLSDSTSSGPKLPNYIFSNFKKSVGDTEDIPTGPKLPNYIFSIFKKSVGDTEDIPTGPKLPNYIFSNFKKSVGNTEDVRERSPLPEAEKVVVNAAN
ncbi:hypothetical protein E4U11_002698 [Claviceps purpurea]|nr:hypothetical protein E4U11_002698 [Claviceps purpurea]